MASLTIRNLDNGLERRLRVRAAECGHAMEEEVRDVLRAAPNQEAAPARNLAEAIRARFQPLGGVDLELPPRAAMREPPRFA